MDLRSKGKEGACKLDLSAVFNQSLIISKIYVAVFNFFSLHTISMLKTYTQFSLKSVAANIFLSTVKFLNKELEIFVKKKKKIKTLTANDAADLSPCLDVASKILVIWKHTASALHKHFLIELFIVGI